MSYAVDKITSHPLTLAKMRDTGEGDLISVHLMPQNLCNQSCSFCSYRLPDNKNSSEFNEQSHIPLEAMMGLLDDLEGMDVQGVEVTGGGEPLAYPFTSQLWHRLAESPMATALVTNGSLLHKHDIGMITSRMKWARVSIDAARPDTYAAMRRASVTHFDRAWAAVASLRQHAPPDPEFKLGVGFVLCNENINEVYDFVKQARSSGADNVRLSLTYSDQHEKFFRDQDALANAIEESKRAEADFNCSYFRVNNLIPVRGWEIHHPQQDYVRCPTKDLLCVVEGECWVYTCCTFTGSLRGRYGKFTEHEGGFRGLWEDFAEWRKDFDASVYCDCSCLYRDRNLAMNDLIDSSETPPVGDHQHREFI